MELTDRVALVTGGSGGLGKATAIALARAGADVSVTFRSGEDRALAAGKAVENAGRRAACVYLDQNDPSSIEAAIDETIAQLGRLDILVNNAGTAKPVPFSDLAALTPEIWDDLMHTNLRGPYLVTRAAGPHLVECGAGHVVNVGAMIGLTPAGSSIAQAVSKAGVIHLTRCLAVALAPKVTVNCVAPGLIEGTQITSGLPKDYVNDLRMKAHLKKSTNIEDVAAQIVQFCRADSITGQVLVIDGGIHFH